MNQTSTKHKPKIREHRQQKQSNINPKSIKSRANIDHKSIINRSSCHLGPKTAPRAKRSQKSPIAGPLGPSIWRPKSNKNRSEGVAKCDYFLWLVLGFGLEQFCANLAPIWHPKPSTNGAMLASKSIQNCCISGIFVDWFLNDFWSKCDWFLAQESIKIDYKINLKTEQDKLDTCKKVM